MKVIYIRDSRSRGYLRLGLSDGEEKIEYTVSESEYRELGSPLIGDEFFDIERIEICDMRYRARLSALRILSYGDNNEKTLKRKLVSKGISFEIASEICCEMVGLGYVNENRQLEKLILAEANVKLSGRKRIFQKLFAKGYKKEDITRALELLISSGEVDFGASRENLIEKKFPDGATQEEVRALLYKYGYTDSDVAGDLC